VPVVHASLTYLHIQLAFVCVWSCCVLQNSLL